MDIIVNEMTSQVHAVDSTAMLHPRVVDPLFDLLLARFKEHLQHEKTVKDEQRMRPSMTSREVSMWE